VRAWRFVLLALAGCATTPTGPAAPLAEPESDARALCAVLARVRPAGSTSALSAHVRAPIFGAAKGDIRDVYRKTAPATVLIRAGDSFGTGIVINAKGYILTNHHVVAPAQTVDFKRRVTVERGRLGANGVMELDPTPLPAWVLKSDPLIDLAVIKLEAPPADLHAIKVASRDPVPGEPVSALGNGGIGLLWAIKDGEISSIGKLSTHLAQLVAARCEVADKRTADEACKRLNASADLEKAIIEREVPGLVIQTSCTISPGDSGGPLVNRASELVGVNAFLRSDPRAPVTSNFHVHVAEVRKFLKDVPAEAVAVVPDPLDLMPFARRLDVDGDGRAELLVDGTGGQANVAVELGSSGRGIDPDLAVAWVQRRHLAWYDLDDDGHFDRVVVQEEDGQAKAWALGPKLKLGKPLGAARLIDAALFTGPTRARMAELVPVVSRLVGGGDAADPRAIPPAAELALAPPLPIDSDRDGKTDAFYVTTLSGARLYLDPSQRTLPGMTQKAAMEGLQKGTLATDVQLFTVGNRTWAFIGSAEHRLALWATANEQVVEEAFFLAPEGRGAAKPELFGVPLFRALARTYRGEELARLLKGFAQASGRVAKSSQYPFPVPQVDVTFEPRAEPSGVAGLEYSAVSGLSEFADVTGFVFELNAEALKGATPESREADFKRGASGTDFAWVGFGDWQWYLYDVDADGTFEAVVIVHGDQVEGRRVAKDGAVTVDAKLSGGKPLKPALFPDARADAARKLGAVFFRPGDLEP